MSRVIVARERVRYAETDRMGVAYNSHFLIWFEVGRSAYMRAAGFPYRDLEAAGYYMPVANFTGEVRESLDYDDEFEIHTWITRVRSRQVVFAYEIRREGRLIGRGETTHVCVDRSRRPVVLPADLRNRLEPAAVVR
jgi:acyl-CoA thioester hydrolase